MEGYHKINLNLIDSYENGKYWEGTNIFFMAVVFPYSGQFRTIVRKGFEKLLIVLISNSLCLLLIQTAHVIIINFLYFILITKNDIHLNKVTFFLGGTMKYNFKTNSLWYDCITNIWHFLSLSQFIFPSK